MSDNKSKIDLTNPIVVCLIATICCFLWGSAFPAIKIGYKIFNIASNDFATQILFAGIRFTFAGFAAIVFGSLLSQEKLYPNKSSLSMIVKLASVQTVGQYICFYVGLANTSGVKASILEAANVFMAILIPTLILKSENLSYKKIIGCLIGFTGVTLINLQSGNIEGGFKLYGEGLILLSDLFYAISAIMIKEFSKNENPVVLSGYQFVTGGIVMVAVGLLLGGRLTTFSISGLIILSYMCLISSVAYSLWSILLKYNPVSKVSIFGFLNPMFGVILSTILLKEGNSFNMIALISLILVCLGIYMVNKENTPSEK